MKKILFFLLLFSVSHLSLANEPSQTNAVDDYALFRQAVALSNQGMWQDAAKLFKDISSRNPGWPEPKNNLAIAQVKMGQLQQAQATIEEAVTSQPSFKIAHSNRKSLYDHSAAMAYYKAMGNSKKKPKLPKLVMLTEVKEVTKVPEQPVVHKTENQTNNRQEITNQIQNTVLNWSEAWSNSDIEQYLAAYSTDFTPSDAKKDYTQWRDLRRAKFQFTKGISVKLDDLKVYLDDNNQHALAEFVQLYKSAKYQDKVVKQLHLINENKRWLILSERVLTQLK